MKIFYNYKKNGTNNAANNRKINANNAANTTANNRKIGAENVVNNNKK